MTYEWKKVELYGQNNDGDGRRFTIADGVSVSKGTLMVLVDPRACSGATTAAVAFAGVSAEEHIGGEGITSITLWTNGIFEAVCSGAVGLGAPVTGEWNCIKAVTALASGANTASGASIIGYSLETGADAEVINVRLRL